ncbi:MAG: glycosyltransferase family 4 protein [Bacteroidetes bacterium]|nr:glycosyltransferase family 4 protein [Bacteroidota bacterium]
MKSLISVLLDGQPLTHRLSGIGKVTLSHLEALAADPRVRAEVVTVSHRDLMVASPVPHHPIPLHSRWGSWWLPWLDRQPDIWHGTNAMFPVFHPGLQPRIKVLTIHDLALLLPGYRHIPEKPVLRWHINRSLKEADAFFCVSKTTADDLAGLVPGTAARLWVIPPDLPGHFYQWSDQFSDLRPAPNPYLLFVGNLNARKNPLAVVRAFTSLKAADRGGFRLVMAGEPGNQWPDLARFANDPDIRFTGYLPDEQIWSLMKQARALLVPSLYEGYGLPVAEALHLNTPVILSDIPVFRELFGGQTDVWVEKETDWRDQLVNIIRSEPVRSKIKNPRHRPETGRYGDVYQQWV